MDRIVGGLILFAVLVLCGAIVMLFAKKKIKATPLIVIGSCCILVTIALLNTVFYYNQNIVEIRTSSEDNSDEFALKVDSRKRRYEYLYTEFSTSSTLKDLTELIRKTYPEDKVSVGDNTVTIVHNNHVISLKEEGKERFLWQSRNVFLLKSRCFNLRFSDNDSVSIPFPTEYLDVEGAYSKKMKLKCDIAELIKFYEGFTNVEFGDNTIILKQDKPILMTVENGEVSFEFQ